MTPPRIPSSDEQMLMKAELLNELVHLLDQHRLYYENNEERRAFGRIMNALMKDPAATERILGFFDGLDLEELREILEQIKKSGRRRTAVLAWMQKYVGTILTLLTGTMIATLWPHIVALLKSGHG